MNGFVKEYAGANCQIYQMKLRIKLCQLILLAGFAATGAQLQLAGSPEPEFFFSGNARAVPVVFSNPTERDFRGEIRTCIYQTSSATTVILSDAPWKEVSVPANETFLDAAALDFPVVKAKTRFLIQWLEETNQVIGTTSVLIYPTNLLELLPPLKKDDFGVFDPNDQLKPLLKAERVPFVDLGEMELAHFTGKLAIIGPFATKAQVPEDLAKQILATAKHNVAVVWIQPPRDENDLLQPSFYSVQKSRTAVLVAQAEMVPDLAENPRSQLNLIYFCQQALYPQPTVLPDLTQQP